MSYGGTWDHGNVRDWRTLHNVGDNAHPEDSAEDIEGTWQYNITMAIAMRMSTAGMRKITEANAEKFFMRCAAIEKLHGNILYTFDGLKRKEYLITLADITRRVGMTASTDKDLTDAAFNKKLIEELEKQAEKRMRAEKRAAEKVKA